MINLAMKYEKSMFELMIDQKSPLVNLTLTDFDQNDHFAPCIQLINFHSKLKLNLLLMDA